MALTNNHYYIYPKFRHNLLTSYDDAPDISYLTLSHGTFEIQTQEAAKFLKIRGSCTGHHTQLSIANKTGIDCKEVKSIIDSLTDINALHLPAGDLTQLSSNEITNILTAAATIWSDQLAETHISCDIFAGETSKNVVIGWLLETYHYVKHFPESLTIAANNAEGELNKLLNTYAKQEKGHEIFILQTLIKAGLSRDEVESSIPLISTRTIDLLLKELFALAPASVLLVASIIEADNFDYVTAKVAGISLQQTHQFPIDMLDPFFKHVRIDSELGHQSLLRNNLHLLQTIPPSLLHDVVNKLHDIKHAFDLQKLEIFDYYDKEGNYIPRQFVDFFAI